MKTLLLAVLLFASSAQALELQNLKFIGTSVLTGDVQLKASEGLDRFQDGPVKIVIEDLAFFWHPVRYFNERRLRIRAGGSTYLFRLPEQAISADGQLDVPASETQQSTGVKLAQQSEFVRTFEKFERVSCSYVCPTTSCSTVNNSTTCTATVGMCAGTERALVRYDEYRVLVNILLQGNSGQIEIQSQPTTTYQEAILKRYGDCY